MGIVVEVLLLRLPYNLVRVGRGFVLKECGERLSFFVDDPDLVDFFFLIIIFGAEIFFISHHLDQSLIIACFRY